MASAQTAAVQPRITAAIDEHNLTTLKGNIHPLARVEFDRGAAPDSMTVRRMLLILKRSPDQEAALDQLMEQQQDASSANFHNWLTPEQFGQQFGPSDQDIQTITLWLQSHGFQVAKVSSGRTVIEFSGTAGQVKEAFHTAIHKYNVNGEEHWANSSDPQIPAAIAPVVAGINTLHNFPRQQMHRIAGTYSRSKATGALTRTGTQFTFPNPCNPNSQPFCNFAVAPADFAKIYDVPNLLLTPAPATQFNGDGITIAIVAQSDVALKDLTDFRTLFGLPAPTLNVILNGPDPGLDPGGAETEADLDVQQAGAVAPHAILDLVVSESTEVSLGADLSAQYAVDNNLAPVLNESFGLCEFAIGTATNIFYNQMWQQAAAQGITVTVSSGDSGAAGCERGPGPASFGLAVSGFTSTPYNVSVGGTDFNDVNSFATFWNTTPSDTPAVASALGYITEMTWNDTCTNQEIFSFFGVSTAEQSCNSAGAQQDGLVQVAGGSGGKSSCTVSDGQNESSCSGGYAKPTWQTALTPADGKRDIPDVSFFAADGFNGSFYLVCEADAFPAGATSCDPNAPQSDAIGLGGTSASSPSFAGIMALVNQATGSRQGNANYILYKLAAAAGATCPSAAKPASTCVFYDIPAGSTIAMPCASGSPNCTVSTAGDQIGVLSGFATSSGYDLATGLGSVNAANLISKWKTFQQALKASTTTLTLNSGGAINIAHGTAVNVNIGVTGTGGTPSGNVSLIANAAPQSAPAEVMQQGVQEFALASGSVTTTTNVLPGSPGGLPYTVFARYTGDGTFGPSDSTPVSVTVTPEASSTSVLLELVDPTTGFVTNLNATTAQYGSSLQLERINVTSKNGDTCAQNAPGQLGCPTGTVTLTNNGTALDGGSFLLNIQGYSEDQNFVGQLPGGTDNLKAVYPGDFSFSGSNGTSVITISKAPTTTTMNVPAKVILGGFNSLTADIASVGVGAGPTGQVTFFTGATQLGSPVSVTNSIAGGPGSTPQAQATITTSALPLGNNSITAQFTGDGNYAPSTALSATVDVQILTGLTLNASSLNINHGSSVTFTAIVNPSQGGGPSPTGTVTFSNGGFVTLAQVPLTNGQAVFTTSSLPGGTDTINANYSGDANYTIAGADTAVVVNLLPTTTVVMTSNANIQQGTSVTLTANVAPVQGGGPALTGTVQFSSAITLQGGQNPLGGPIALVNGQAQLTTSTILPGAQFVLALYSGDSNYATSSGSTAEVVTAAPTFTVTANPVTIVVTSPGQSGNTLLTFTGQNGFSSNGSVTLAPSSCMSLPSESSCSFNPATITIATNGTATSTLSVRTTAPSAVMPNFSRRPDRFDWRMTTATALALACLFCAGMLAFGYRGKQRRWGLALVFTIFVMLAVSAGCGGGSGGPPPPPPVHDPGTPVATGQITVTITINGVTETVPGLVVQVQ